jgi:hypothetical protein
LFHDIGKPSVYTSDDEGRAHFYGHSNKSAEIAENIGIRLRFSNKERRYLEAVIRGHEQPLFLFLAKEKDTLTHRGVTRFFMRSGDYTPDLLLHSIADGKGKGNIAHDAAFTGFVSTLLGKYFRDHVPRTLRAPLLTGHDLMESFALSPSPFFKIVLGTVEEERLAGRIQSREAALITAKGIIDGQIDVPTPNADSVKT